MQEKESKGFSTMWVVETAAGHYPAPPFWAPAAVLGAAEHAHLIRCVAVGPWAQPWRDQESPRHTSPVGLCSLRQLPFPCTYSYARPQHQPWGGLWTS